MIQLSASLRRYSLQRRDRSSFSPLSRRPFSTSLNSYRLRHKYNNSVQKPYVSTSPRTLLRGLSTPSASKVDTNVGKRREMSGSATECDPPTTPDEPKKEVFEIASFFEHLLKYRQQAAIRSTKHDDKPTSQTSPTESAQHNLKITTGESVTSAGKKTIIRKSVANATMTQKTEDPVTLAGKKTTTRKSVANATMAEKTEDLTDSPKKSLGKTSKATLPEGTTAPPRKKTKKKDKVFTQVSGKAFDYKTIHAKHSTDPPTLSHGLERVLFNPGVHFLQDPRTKVMNFSPYLKKIVQPHDIDFNSLPIYTTSSQDPDLMGLANEQGKKFVGSTSTLTTLLSQIYLLITNGKPPNISMLSKSFAKEETDWGRTTKEPAAIFLRYKDGVYAIDRDTMDGETILMQLGRSMELMLTVSPEEFSKSVKKSSVKSNPDEDKKSAYFYGSHEDCLFRSQLDAQDPRLPGRTFDVKTRGSVGIRLNPGNHEDFISYYIKQNQGEWESFEREYYDLIRSAFLKYYFQVCIGKMDGVFMAYHNTETIFGFQYIPKEEMEACLFGNSVTGQEAFGVCLQILQDLLKTVTSKHPEQSLRVGVRSGRLHKRISRMTVFTEVIPYDLALKEDDMRLYEDKIDPKLSKYQVDAYSTVNGSELEDKEKISLSADGSDDWTVHYNIEETKDTLETIIDEYNTFNIYFDTYYKGNEGTSMSPFQQNIYDIARRNLADDEVATDFQSSILEEDIDNEDKDDLSTEWCKSEHQVADVTLYDDEISAERLTEDQEEKQDATPPNVPPANLLEQLCNSKDLSKDIADLSINATRRFLQAFLVPCRGPPFAVRAMMGAIVQYYKEDKNAKTIVEIWEATTKDLQDDSNDGWTLKKADSSDDDLSQKLSETKNRLDHRMNVNRTILKRLDQIALNNLAEKLCSVEESDDKSLSKYSDMDAEEVQSAIGSMVARAMERVEESKPGIWGRDRPLD